ncbi:Acg family FMN-binding oxidoreductase [Halorubrum sp. Ea8]|uniref:Acg family FMN-binding oxidoreductase n=1 Tax=Halorubrum sp. Ea8 TaxID=1383841 RepID=UPI000B99C6B8|nr:nitroreductase [Halorubrum sp. Ea8]OYR49376.1 nitroreductase [Halorubrum sp. Ea8]
MPTADLTQSVWDLDTDEFPSTGDIEEQATFLLRYAILAPSSHNSQPWEFRVTGNEIDVGADESRWLEAADPEKRELYISVGCALENLCIAAEHFGFDPQIAYHGPNNADYVATVTLLDDAEVSTSRPSELFGALTTRYTSHEPFENRLLGDGIYEKLKALVVEDDVSLHLVDNSDIKTAISELQVEADRLLMEDPAYRKELGHWIGLGALGSSWLMARIGQAVVTHLDIGDREAKKNSTLIESAPVLGVLTAASDDSTAQVRTGQAFERVALLATTDGVAVHPMSQTLERPELRARLGELLDTAGVPQHLFRLGYTDEAAEHTPRWPLETFLDDE